MKPSTAVIVRVGDHVTRVSAVICLTNPPMLIESDVVSYTNIAAVLTTIRKEGTVANSK